ncbi:hypothetical protein BJ165DRAFT_345448 [Panaeolus papilionaceus]|nr:hypothetical protein BJ165DRAFT_345448 [Panaeolus papilionaceus]
MSNHYNGLRTSTLRLFFLILCWTSSYPSVLADPRIIDDSDPAIRYSPQSFWFSNSGACPTSLCLNPGGTTSWHEAIVVGPDPDHHPPGSGSASSTSFAGAAVPTDNLQAAPSTSPPPSGASPKQQAPPQAAPPSASSSKKVAAAGGSATQTAAPAQTSTTHVDNDGDGGDDGDDGDKGRHGGSNSGSTQGGSGSNSGSGGKRELLQRRADTDGLITLSYNFTGSAISIFAVLPPASVTTPLTPTNMDVTITLDNNSTPPVRMDPVAGSTTYNSQQIFNTAFAQDGLHQLVITVNPNSTFIFDYINITTSSTNPASTPSGQNPPSTTVDPNTKKHNVATFAGALGGSVGVLGLFSLGLAISIIRRRRRAARRDRRDHESLHTNSSDDSPDMSGPAPFVPRFFPGTVIPAEPPTYHIAVTSNRVENPVLVALAGNAYADRHLSYADIPPESPPPPDDESVIMPPPPPFSVPEESVAASSTPPSRPPSLAAAESHPASTVDSEGTSQQEDSVATAVS